MLANPFITDLVTKHPQVSEDEEGGKTSYSYSIDVMSAVFLSSFLRDGKTRDCTHPGVSDSRPYWHDVAEVHPNPHGRSIFPIFHLIHRSDPFCISH